LFASVAHELITIIPSWNGMVRINALGYFPERQE
jgi:hypothetical protein